AKRAPRVAPLDDRDVEEEPDDGEGAATGELRRRADRQLALEDAGRRPGDGGKRDIDPPAPDGCGQVEDARRGHLRSQSLVLVRVVDVPSGHRDPERAERVLHPDRVAVRGEDFGQALVDLRRLARAAADEDDSPLPEAGLDRRPVDEARPHHLPATLPSPHLPGGLRAAHHTSHPWTVEKSACSVSLDSTPSRITDSSPIEPPTKP